MTAEFVKSVIPFFVELDRKNGKNVKDVGIDMRMRELLCVASAWNIRSHILFKEGVEK